MTDETMTERRLLACPHCRSIELRAWYMDPVGYDVTIDIVGEDDETHYSDSSPTISEGGEFDDYSCRGCGAVGLAFEDLVEVEETS